MRWLSPSYPAVLAEGGVVVMEFVFGFMVGVLVMVIVAWLMGD